jgi:hypothetical protein
MTEKEFLNKYGNEKVYFQRMYKNSIYYKNIELGFWCKATIEYDDEIEVEETVYSIFQFAYFEFGLIK